MRKLLLSILGASALAMASAAGAQAVIIQPGAPVTSGSDPSTVFLVSPSPVPPDYTGSIVATIGHTGIAEGNFDDIFQFTIGTLGMGLIGTGSGSVTTTVDLAGFLGAPDLDITQVLINGTLLATQTLRDLDGNPCTVEGVGSCGATETFAASNVPITAGVLNTIEITGVSRGNGSYGGNLTFTPGAVPEPATWGMMLLGFAGIGWQLRRKGKNSAALAQLA
jgi:hypothetical protein